jgi:hypothetical protein
MAEWLAAEAPWLLIDSDLASCCGCKVTRTLGAAAPQLGPLLQLICKPTCTFTDCR